MQKSQSMSFKTSTDSMLKAYLLKVQWTAAHFILAGHARISLSSERSGAQGCQARIWFQIKWDKPCTHTHLNYVHTTTRTVLDIHTSKHGKSCLQSAFKSFAAMQADVYTCIKYQCPQTMTVLPRLQACPSLFPVRKQSKTPDAHSTI